MASFFTKLNLWDKKISGKIVENSANKFQILSFFALSGNGQPWVIASVLFFIFDIFMERSENLVIFASISLANLFNLILKFSIKRRRPNEDVSKRYVTQIDFNAFPSGHACRMGAMAMLMILFFPKIGWLFALWAIAVGYGRIALQLHYLVDIVGGTIIGAALSTFGFIFYDRIAIFIEPLIDWISKAI
ncbi:MAG: phosphatase PAP2 family protein [Candidatus Heimdallarchaeota archaeon]|nr:phosphatase PAP2 family protein [Candidatus Heimdallarchaeota archaeon]MCK4955604.1 phosphatase PAP2 family protein [Candidatus Heimdallarchaeota archaeon]